MRLRISGVPAVIGTAVALLATVVIALPRDSDRGARHNAVRATRGGVQRLDSTESAHVVEDPEAVLTVASDGLGDFAVSASSGAGGHVAAAWLAERPAFVGDATSLCSVISSADLPPRSCRSRPALGRAPPTV
jgi:hypothetical protein